MLFLMLPSCRDKSIRYLKRVGLALFLAGVFASPIMAQRGALTIPRSLDELVDRAATIVRGNVVHAAVQPHPKFANVQTLVVTVRVRETLKGQAKKYFTFRQYIWDVRDRFDTAGYRKGQHLLLLMHGPSRYGLSSPVGLEQGRFRILRDQVGKEYAVNGRANVGLFREMAPRLQQRGVDLQPVMARLVSQHRKGPVKLDELTNLVRTITRSN